MVEIDFCPIRGTKSEVVDARLVQNCGYYFLACFDGNGTTKNGDLDEWYPAHMRSWHVGMLMTFDR